MDFFRVWLTGYYNLSMFARVLQDGPAPHRGLYAQGLRALMDALLLCLALALLGAQPAMPSYLTLLPIESYYAASVVLAFVFRVAQLAEPLGVLFVRGPV